ncbi:hypothetical protein D0962_03310 [Leptolyngbyaceae cyanobacterium CCMR0082]|uniref:Uncharacterized protein n=2 Tax=Adonisia turfae TaxID=2950184 RepID=A0A6M0S0Q1_9CYAN|nr:hypothetical protein [Adonisia turfae]NEZ55865.1 hypothetical protein [Adonisia turfae CCMR0081]NEZ61810.1 hypothetical protein [Adonisia turfae CCMR0082]
MEWRQKLNWAADSEDWYSWSYQAGIAIGTKLIDDVVVNHITTHPDALVIELGSDLSSCYDQVASEKLILFEVD